MYNTAYKKIAEGHRLMEEGYLELADCYLPDDSSQLEKREKTKAAKAKKEEVQPDKAEEVKAEESTVTVEMIRAVMAKKSQDGKTKEIKALLEKYDAGKLSGVKPEDYPALLKEAEVL